MTQKMTSTQLIGRDTMIARLVFFHNARIDRAFPNHTPEWRAEKKAMFAAKEYEKQSTRSICKEYDTTFEAVSDNTNIAEY